LTAVIRLEGLSRSFGATKALSGVTAELPGGAMGLLGPNGAGKTTLLRILLGLLPPGGGRAEVLGLDAARQPLAVRARVGYMPESDCSIPRLTGVRLVAFAAELAGLPRKASLSRAHEVLYYVGLGEVRYRKVDEYSQGMRQRMRLAQAIVHDPEVLFLDEPTSGMDPAGRREMLSLIRDLARNHGKHVLLSSHVLPDVEGVCTFALLLDRGRLAAAGDLAALRGGGDHRFEVRVRGSIPEFIARLATEGIAAALKEEDRLEVRLPAGTIPLFAAARDAGTEVLELRAVAPSLEEALLRVLRTPAEAR
jgi:ABC-2 type transport system ATP-binding protein